MPIENSLQIQILDEDAVVPTYGSPDSAGLDLYALENHLIASGQTEVVHTGIAVKIPDGFFGGIYARSGIALKKGLRPGNCTGVIDADYTGEILVALHNDSLSWQSISKGDRIAQLIVQPYMRFDRLETVRELPKTERGNGGFGHTGN